MKTQTALGFLFAVTALAIGLSGCMGVAAVAANYGAPRLAAPCTSGGAGSAQRRCESLTFGGTERNYRVYVPAKLAEPAPVIVVLHGATQNGAIMEVQTGKGFDHRADETGVLVVYPDSVGARWNDGRREAAPESGQKSTDDVAFLRALVASLSQHYAIDSQRVFVTGFSNGGGMALRLACEATEIFHGFVAVGANLSADVAQHCHPSDARRVALIHGTADLFNLYSGGTGGIYGRALSVEATFDVFRAIAGCTGEESSPWPEGVRESQSNVILHRALGCQGDLSVLLYQVKGGLHNWPGVSDETPRSFVSRDDAGAHLDATAETWRFLGLPETHRETQISIANSATR